MQKLNTSLTPVSETSETPIPINRDQIISEKLQKIDQGTHKALETVELKTTQVKDAVSDYTKSNFMRLKDWYLALDRVKQVGLSLLIIPLLLILFLLSSVIFPLISIVWPFLFMALNFTLIASKLALFIVYISYKVMKTLMGIYYCISRTISARKANLVREKMMQMGVVHTENPPALWVGSEIAEIKFQSKWKRLEMVILPSDSFFAELQNELKISDEMIIEQLKQSKFQLNFLMSYLRYFLLGQKALYVGLWQSKREIFTIWRAESREVLKKKLSLVGATIFTPHLLGAYLNREQILVPGDFEFHALKLNKIDTQDRHATQTSTYQLEIIGNVPWKSWTFDRHFPFAHGQDHQEKWVIKVKICLKDLLALEAKARQSQAILNLMSMQEEEGFDDDHPTKIKESL
jgi:hypothetical protein